MVVEGLGALGFLRGRPGAVDGVVVHAEAVVGVLWRGSGCEVVVELVRRGWAHFDDSDELDKRDCEVRGCCVEEGDG